VRTVPVMTTAEWKLKEQLIQTEGSVVRLPSHHCRHTSSGSEPSRIGTVEVPIPRDTYIAGPFVQYHPAT